jgi:hypothetical protein
MQGKNKGYWLIIITINGLKGFSGEGGEGGQVSVTNFKYFA